MRPAVSVVIPARNAAPTIGRTLRSLQNQTLPGPEFQVVLVDDGSTDDTVAIAEASGARVITQHGVGPGEARNRGVEASEAEIIAFTDADCFPARDWLENGLMAMGEADLVQGRVLPDRSAARSPFDHTIWVVRESGLYETANLFVRRELFEEVGGFEDWLEVRIGKRLGEDVWFGWKAKRAGARTAYCEQALVEHAVFSRRWFEYVDERRRLVYFPDLVQKVPELRRSFLFAEYFVTRRSAAFVLALTTTAVLLGLRRMGLNPWVCSSLLIGGCTPYVRLAAPRALRDRRCRRRVAAADLAADVVGFGALVLGSARRRTLVL